MGAFIRHTVTDADTLRGLAQAYLGTHVRWVEIAHLNRLEPSQFDLAGIRELLIPVAVGPDGVTDDLYLKDLAVVGGGLVITEAGQLGTVSGLKNLAVSILRALVTDRGSLLDFQLYGLSLEKYVAFAGGALFLRFLALEAERVILRDGRVSHVKDLRVTLTEQSLQITGAIFAVGSADSIDLVARRTYR